MQYCLDFLRKKNVSLQRRKHPRVQIKLVNIRPEDIVEGNGKLTLGLIWTIILNFQVSMIKHRQRELAAALAGETGYANGHTSHADSSASAASSFYSSSASVVLNNKQRQVFLSSTPAFPTTVCRRPLIFSIFNTFQSLLSNVPYYSHIGLALLCEFYNGLIPSGLRSTSNSSIWALILKVTPSFYIILHIFDHSNSVFPFLPFL